MTNRSSRAGGALAGVVLIGLGVLFLLGQFFNFSAWRYLWPFAVLAFGALFFAGMVAGGKSAGGLAIPGSIITMIGLVLFFQTLTGRWESWAYGWTFIVIAVGVGLFIMGWWTGEAERRQSGLRVAAVGFVLFVLFGSIFELGAGLFGARDASQLVFPVLLIGVGLYLLATRSGLLPRLGGPAAMPSAPATVPPPAPEPEPPAPEQVQSHQ